MGQVQPLRVVGQGRSGHRSLSFNCQKGLIGNIAAVNKVIWVIREQLRKANGQWPNCWRLRKEASKSRDIKAWVRPERQAVKTRKTFATKFSVSGDCIRYWCHRYQEAIKLLTTTGNHSDLNNPLNAIESITTTSQCTAVQLLHLWHLT